MAKKTDAFRKAVQSYQKEHRRLRQFVTRAEKRGYQFDNPTLDYLMNTGRPETTKDIKKAVRLMKELTPEKLYKTAEFADIVSGELLSGLEGRKLERSRASRLGQFRKSEGKLFPVEENVVIQNLRDMLNTFSPTGWDREIKLERRNTVQSILNETISRDGENAVARRLQNESDYLHNLLDRILYLSETPKNVQQIEFDIVEFATIIRGSSLTLEESLDLTEELELEEI